MGNIHFRVEHMGQTSIRCVELNREVVCYATLLTVIKPYFPCDETTTRTLEFEQETCWQPLNVATRISYLIRTANGHGTALSPIRLRITDTVHDATPDVVHFVISEKNHDDVRFRLDREAVSLAVLTTEAVSRYGPGAMLSWAFGSQWVRLDDEKDVTYMLENTALTSTNGRPVAVSLKVRYPCPGKTTK